MKTQIKQSDRDPLSELQEEAGSGHGPASSAPSPDPVAVATMAGFDDLPPSLRHLLNYGPATMRGGGDCIALLAMIAKHGELKVTLNLADILRKVETLPPHFFSRDRGQPLR